MSAFIDSASLRYFLVILRDFRLDRRRPVFVVESRATLSGARIIGSLVASHLPVSVDEFRSLRMDSGRIVKRRTQLSNPQPAKGRMNPRDIASSLQATRPCLNTPGGTCLSHPPAVTDPLAPPAKLDVAPFRARSQDCTPILEPTWHKFDRPHPRQSQYLVSFTRGSDTCSLERSPCRTWTYRAQPVGLGETSNCIVKQKRRSAREAVVGLTQTPV